MHLSGLNISKVFVLLVILTGVSCETERVLFKGPYYVRFTEANAFSKESFSKPINIQVHNAGPAAAGDILINFSVSGNAREGVDYVFVSEKGTVIIKKGNYFGNITIKLLNNSNNILRTQDIIFTLLGTNAVDVKVGQGESNIGNSFTFTIFDDCLLGGYYSGTSSTFSVPVTGLTIVSDDCERYILSNWNIDFFNTPFDMDLIFIDKGDNTLDIPQQKEDNLPDALSTIIGTGVVDPVTREINMTIQLLDFEGQPEVSFTLIPD
jgi:hypothetical protein